VTSIVRTLRSVLRFRRFEIDPVARRLSRAANVSDLRRIARRRLPRGVFGYVDGAAEDELTAARNLAAYRNVEFRPRVLRNVDKIDTSTSLLGQPLAFPLVLAPTGFTRMVDPEGELAVARAAARAGLPYTLSTMSTRSIEEVAAVSEGRKWFQVYVWRDRGLVNRERDIRRGFTLPPKMGLDTIVDGALHLPWTWNFVRSEPITFPNVAGNSAAYGADPLSLTDFIDTQFDAALSWDDIAWFRSVWDGPIVLKGIQTVEDARLAADAGVQAIALSNHGGRQLEGAPLPLELVGPVAEAVGGSRSSATAASGAAATSSRRSPSAPTPAWPGGPTSTPLAPVANAALIRSSRNSTKGSAGRWPSRGPQTSTASRPTSFAGGTRRHNDPHASQTGG